MSRRNQYLVLGALLVILAGAFYWNRDASPGLLGDVAAGEAVQPLRIENPSLHLDQLERIRKLEYSGTHRNIFSASLPPPPPSAAANKPAVTGPPVPPPPPPVDVSGITFFGMVTDAGSGRRRAFFTNGDDVFIAAEGDTLLNRLRVVRIGNNTVDVEEISSGRHATLTMEQPPNPQS